MKIKLLFLFLFLGVTNAFAQQNSILVQGDYYKAYLLNEGESVANIHIVNKNKNTVTISDEKGYFQILCNVGDILIISAVNFEQKEIKIPDDFNTYQVHFIDLENRIELEEVEIKSHDLTGTLSFDSEKVPESDLSKINPDALDFTAAYGNFGYDLNDKNSGAPIVNTVPGNNIGGDVIGMAAFIAAPIVKVLGPSDLKQRVREKEYLRAREYEELTKNLPSEMLKRYGKTFFTDRIGIPENKIEDFVKFCYKDEIVGLYQDEKHLELIEILIKNKDPFLNR
ncbi:carboxypeptidase-like regulatory domain-containing protein [Aureivirga sp. CE67]|uniref:carboxypeptidase-like regulatory domain-containing protein n=1 Tax=Aureivirga sp. CE67 TaxID=1788983 RepID=UPI0018C9B007|nr:carboxypeptidase-like regulatory domain-containing protein [Aureivirga sp. CE67]